MEKFYSKIDSEKLLHLVFRKKDFITQRQDLIDASQFIQCAALKMPRGLSFKPHKHFFTERTENKIAQESWVVIQGRVKCIFYDLDNKILATPILEVGDSSFTLEGGHTYDILEDNTLVYEFKTGPYYGQKHDKVFI